MKKAIILIAVIVCASASSGFLSNFRKMQKQIDDQYEQQLDLMRQAQDLADATANGQEPDPKKIAETIQGLTQAAQFWGSFIGDDTFDTKNLVDKMNYISDNQDKFNEYTTADAKQVLVNFNIALWDINVAVKTIQSLAIQLKRGAQNVQKISGIAFRENMDMLEGKYFKMYQAAIKLLYNTLKSGLANCKDVKDQLNKTSVDLLQIEKDLSDIGDELAETAKGEGKKFRDWRDKKRAEVYGGCVASVLCGPMCVTICYSVGAGVLESEINDYKERTEKFMNEYNNFAAGFYAMSTMATQASKVSQDWYFKVQDFENEIQTQYNLIDTQVDIAWVAQDLRDLIDASLDSLIAECDKLIKDTTGRLEEMADEQSFNQEFSGAAEHVQKFDAQAKIAEMCGALNKNKFDFERCVQAAKESLENM